MRRVALLAALLLTGCSATFTVVDYPYCPTSDSARAHADSIPLGCDVDSMGVGP